MFQLQGRKSACTTMCGQQRNSPMADPIFGSKYGPQNGVQNWIKFSFLLLGLCLGPVLGSRFGPKSGVSHRRILLLPAEVLQADLRRTSMSVSVNTCFFSLCVPLCFLYSSNRTWDAQREKGMSWHSCSSCRVANLLAQHVRAATKFSDGWPHFWVQIWIPKRGPSKDLRPQNGVQNWIKFSFLLLGLCLGPVLGSRFGPKSGVSHRRILLLPAEVLQADLRRTSMSVSVNTCFFSLCVPLCFLYSRGPFLAAMFLLVFWILFWGPWWSRFVGIRGTPRLTEACPRHAWQELLWKKPPLRTSTCGRHRFRRNHPLWEPRMWQSQVWEARPDGESTRGKAKFGKRHGSRKWEEENSSTRRRHRGKGRKRQKTPSPPYNVPHIQASAGRVAFYYFVFLKRRKCIRGHFFGGFGIRSGPSQGFSRIRRGIRRHPRVRWQICESKWLLFRTLPCDVAA